MKKFRYADGRQVCVGDVVSSYSPENLGVVAFIAARGSDLVRGCDNGDFGVFIHFLNGCDCMYDDLSDMEDLEYVRPFDEEICHQFKRRGRTFDRYMTGEAICAGDHVVYENGGSSQTGRIVEVISPFSENSWGTWFVLGACKVYFECCGEVLPVCHRHTLRLVSRGTLAEMK